MNITVSHGSVIINSIAVVTEHDDVCVYEIDCRTKYAQAVPGSGNYFQHDQPDIWTPSLMMYADEDTLYTADTPQPTELYFPGFDGITVSGGRYSFVVTVYKRSYANNKYVWSLR